MAGSTMEQVESGSDDLLFTEWQTLINQTPVAAHELLLSLSDKELHHLVTIFMITCCRTLKVPCS